MGGLECFYGFPAYVAASSHFLSGAFFNFVFFSECLFLPLSVCVFSFVSVNHFDFLHLFWFACLLSSTIHKFYCNSFRFIYYYLASMRCFVDATVWFPLDKTKKIRNERLNALNGLLSTNINETSTQSIYHFQWLFMKRREEKK